LDKAVSCFDVPNSVHFNILYHLPNATKSNGFFSKMTNGWWVSSLVTVQQGASTTPTIGPGERSFSGIIQQSNNDYASLNTSAVSNFCPTSGSVPCSATQTAGSLPYNWIPFDPKTVVTGDPNHWYNPLMFGEAPLGQLGNSPRNFLRLPGLGKWDFSLVKDTKLGFLGEQGGLEFRAEFFNIINRVNFGAPATTIFTSTLDPTTGAGGNLQAPNGANASNPLGTATQITTTNGTSRQIQLALKVIF
jgi:hypothetical protein